MSTNTSSRTYDSLHMGRSSIDLYSNDVGAPFEEINSFAAYVGGSPTNISVGARRLGLKSALLTGFGVDPVGDFIKHFLNKEGVVTDFCVDKPGHRTSAVVLGIEPPDKFPLVYYRDNCADIELTIDDVLAAPVADAKVLQFAGTNFCKEPSRSATMFAAEYAQQAGTEVVLDIDFRPDQWHDPRAFGVVIRSVMPLVDIVIGTEDEINASMLTDPAQMSLTHSQISDTKVTGDVNAAIDKILSLGPKAVVEKVGALGHACIWPRARRSKRPAILSKSTTSSARAMPSARAFCMASRMAGAGASRPGWAMPAGPSSSPSMAVPTSRPRMTR